MSCFLLFPVSAFAKAGNKNSRWVATPVVIDGNNEEWPQPYAFTEEIDTRMQYAFANDAHTLYLTLKTSDETTKAKLRTNGLTVFIDTTGQKMLATSFGFSVTNKKTDPAAKQDNNGSNAKAGQKSRKQKEVPGNTADEKASLTIDDATANRALPISAIQLVGTPCCDGTYAPEANKPGIRVAAAVNDLNELVWEIAIPFTCIYASGDEKVMKRKKISVGFTVFGLDNNQIAELTRAVQQQNKNAMPVAETDSSAAHSDEGDGHPVINPNGTPGASIGGGKSKGKGSNPPADIPVFDAVAAMQDRQRAGQDFQVWKRIRLSYQP